MAINTIDIKSIEKCAEDAQAILAKVKTVEDVISLRRIGIPEKDVYLIDIGDGLTDSFYLHEMDPDTKIYAIMLYKYNNGTCCIYYPCYEPKLGNDPFSFDIYDDDSDAVILEDQHINNVEENYQDICLALFNDIYGLIQLILILFKTKWWRIMAANVQLWIFFLYPHHSGLQYTLFSTK
jgi:hypothetical protein